MQAVANAFKYLTQAFNLNLGKYTISVVFWQVAAIVFLLFLLVLSMAQFRRHYVDWGLKGAAFGIFFGFLLALTIEGFLIVGGKTALTEFLGWKNAPLPLQMALDSGKKQLIKVLGIDTVAIPASLANETLSVQDAVGALQSMNPADLKKVKNLICQP